jgi:hypothetical protein
MIAVLFYFGKRFLAFVCGENKAFATERSALAVPPAVAGARAV